MLMKRVICREGPQKNGDQQRRDYIAVGVVVLGFFFQEIDHPVAAGAAAAATTPSHTHTLHVRSSATYHTMNSFRGLSSRRRPKKEVHTYTKPQLTAWNAPFTRMNLRHDRRNHPPPHRDQHSTQKQAGDVARSVSRGLAGGRGVHTGLRMLILTFTTGLPHRLTNYQRQPRTPTSH
jgi:hypothetical protein